MASSLRLISAQVQFMDARLALIHIPLDLYPFFVQPILQLIFSHSPGGQVDDNPDEPPPVFLNVSITPVECSVVCSRHLAEKYFRPMSMHVTADNGSKVMISKEDYVVVQVEGEGLDAGSRVLDLTSPLAMAGISIFFITTYFSDYILVPIKSRAAVIRALEARGFHFDSADDSNGVPNHGTTSPILSIHSHIRHSSSSTNSTPPTTPPPSNLTELQARTFAHLRRKNIVPYVDRSIRLVQRACSKDLMAPFGLGFRLASSHPSLATNGGSSTNLASSIAGLNGTISSMSDSRHDPRIADRIAKTQRLQLGLLSCLIETPHPRFLSITVTDLDPMSMLLEKSLLPRFGIPDDSDDGGNSDSDGENGGTMGYAAATDLLLGSNDVYIPITLDLRDLPLEATGIVCGVAGRLAEATSGINQVDLREKEEDLSSSVEQLDLSDPSPPVTMTSSITINNGASGPTHYRRAEQTNYNHTSSTESVSPKAKTRYKIPNNHYPPMTLPGPDPVEISFLSTALSGTVVVGETELERAIRALQAAEREEGWIPYEQ